MQDPNCNKSNSPQLNDFELYNIDVIKDYEAGLDSGSGSGSITLSSDAAHFYDLPIISLGHYGSSYTDFSFNDLQEVDGGYTIVCEFLEFSEDPEGGYYSDVIDTQQLFIAGDAPVHTIRGDWTGSESDPHDHMTFEEYMDVGSSYGMWPDFFALIDGDEIIEMVEMYTP